MANLKGLKNAHGICVVMAISIFGIIGCSKDAKNSSSATSDSTETTSTAAAVDADSQQLEFFTERYLAPEQRLKRRQDRVEAVLSAP